MHLYTCAHRCGGILPSEQHFNLGYLQESQKIDAVDTRDAPGDQLAFTTHPGEVIFIVLPNTPGQENPIPIATGHDSQGEPCGSCSPWDVLLCIQPEQHSYLWCMGLNLYI